ncbi:MAG: c-type heme family protein [Hyphomicrobiaceae bacterium]
MSLRLKLNIIISSILLLGMLVTFAALYRAGDESARADVLKKLTAIKTLLLSVRDYTSNEVRPLLEDASQIQFLAQTVPAFAARTAFAGFRENNPDYSYNEAALNPMNAEDQPQDWEREIIEKLRSDRKLQQLVEVRTTADGERLTVAFPIEIKSESCLACHASAAKAPQSLVALYGDKNGFGWKMNEVVGAQFISVPLSRVQNPIVQNLALVAGTFVGAFVVLLILLNVLLNWLVVSPIKGLAGVAQAVSMGDSDQPEFVLGGSDEIASLSQSFNRMRRSLDNAMKMLEN